MRQKIAKILLGITWISTGGSGMAQDKAVPRIDSVMRLASERGIFNGNVLVAKTGKIIYQAGFGYAEAGKKGKLRMEMLFDIGSVSKEFNGTGIMLLREQGRLDLDDPVSRFLPTLPDWAKQVKIRHLISYTSGIPLFDPLANESEASVFENLMNLKTLQFQPGTAYLYNHYNVFLQMRVIEKASGMAYGDFIARYILQPLGMTNTVVDYPVTGPRMAQAFDSQFRATPYAQGMTGWVRLSTADLYKFADALDHYRLISPAAYRELAWNFPSGESSLGSTGFEGEKLLWHQHQGSNSNYESLVYNSLSDSIAVVLMTNHQQMKVHGIRRAIFDAIQGRPVDVPKKSVYLEVREKMLDDVQKGLAYYRLLKATAADRYDFSFEIGDLLSAGKFLQRRKHYTDALLVFDVAVRLDGQPADISYGYELMGDTYRKMEDTARARMFYQKAIETDPANRNAHGMLETLKRSN